MTLYTKCTSLELLSLYPETFLMILILKRVLMFTKKKYKLLPKEKVTAPNGQTYEAHRIQALIDILLHGVKAGDIGGYVTDKKALSQKGSCWVGGDAFVKGLRNFSIIDDDALVTDNAFVAGFVVGASKVYGNAMVYNADIMGNCDISGNAQILKGSLNGNITVNQNARFLDGQICSTDRSQIIISGHAVWKSVNDFKEYGIHTMLEEKVKISGRVTLDNVKIKGNCTIDTDVSLLDVTFSGDNTITGNPQIKPETKFSGRNVIGGSCIIPPQSHVHGVVMDSGILNYSSPGFSEQQSITGAVFLPSLPSPEIASTAYSNPSNETNEYVALIEQIEAEYEAYTTDVVKLIKYPAMVDTSVPEVGDFVVKLRSAKRVVNTSNADRIKEVAEALEMAFVNAENKVQTLVASHLDENKKKALKTAEKMFKLACDDASPEPEKRLGYKAGMRSLEGVIVVSDKATENLKAKIGILELEA